jgi:hypothetical protein
VPTPVPTPVRKGSESAPSTTVQSLDPPPRPQWNPRDPINAICYFWATKGSCTNRTCRYLHENKPNKVIALPDLGSAEADPMRRRVLNKLGSDSSSDDDSSIIPRNRRPEYRYPSYDLSPSPPSQRLRTRVIKTRERGQPRSPSPVLYRVYYGEREIGESSQERIRARTIQRESFSSFSSFSPSPSPSPYPPPLRAPLIHQEIITHYQHIDHGNYNSTGGGRNDSDDIEDMGQDLSRDGTCFVLHSQVIPLRTMMATIHPLLLLRYILFILFQPR